MIIESVLFGLLSAIALGISDVMAAGITRRLGVLRSAASFQLVTVSVFSLYLLTGTGIGLISGADWALMAGMSVVVFGFYVALYKALQLGPVAIVGPILAAHSVIVVLMSVFILGERLSPHQFLSILTIIFGVALASIDIHSLRSRHGIVGLGIGLAIFSSLAAGVWQYSIGVLSKELGWFLPMYISRVLLLSMLMPIALWRRSWPLYKLTWPTSGAVVTVALLESGGLFAFARGAEIGLISIVGAAATVYPVFPILGGVYLYKERLDLIQWVGLCFVIFGLVGLATLR